MKYLTFIRHSESYRESPPPAALMEAMGRFVEKSLKEGVLVDTGGLLPSKDGVRVRLANGTIKVTDGPFSESKEVIGGWAILKTDSRAEAPLHLARAARLDARRHLGRIHRNSRLGRVVGNRRLPAVWDESLFEEPHLRRERADAHRTDGGERLLLRRRNAGRHARWL